MYIIDLPPVVTTCDYLVMKIVFTGMFENRSCCHEAQCSLIGSVHALRVTEVEANGALPVMTDVL
jgi:hypothetical protein